MDHLFRILFLQDFPWNTVKSSIMEQMFPTFSDRSPEEFLGLDIFELSNLLYELKVDHRPRARALELAFCLDDLDVKSLHDIGGLRVI